MDANQYQRFTQEQHILSIPETYLGSDKKQERTEYLLFFEQGDSGLQVKACPKNIDLPIAIERTFIELLTNAEDNVDRTLRMRMDPGSIWVTMDNEWVCIRNEGLPIPVQINEQENMYVPEMVFGTLLTSCHYTNKTEHFAAGKNGYGCKLSNLFSVSFQVAVGDAINKKEFVQHYGNNMSERTEAKVTPYAGSTSYVCVRYKLDFSRFGYTEYPPETMALFARLTAEVSVTCKVPVYFNDQLIDLRSNYHTLYFDEQDAYLYVVQEMATNDIPFRSPKKGGAVMPASPKAKRTKLSKEKEYLPYMELCLLNTPDDGKAISFVNGLLTNKNGVHVDAVYKALLLPVAIMLQQALQSEGAGSVPHETPVVTGSTVTTVIGKISIKDLKQHLSMIGVFRLTAPQFDSQSKNTLHGPVPNIRLAFAEVQSLQNWSFIHYLLATWRTKQTLRAQPNNAKKATYVSLSKPQAHDANEAGTAQSQLCELWLVEGSSAFRYAKTKMELMPQGNDYIGIYPLKGKLMNAFNNKREHLERNTEYKDIVTMLGMKENALYTSTEALRYGRIRIMTDQDVDGNHISALIIALFERKAPSLLQLGIIYRNDTPIIRARTKQDSQRFYNDHDFQQWLQTMDPQVSRKYKITYYKGLGSSEKPDVIDDNDHPRTILFLTDPAYRQSLINVFHSAFAETRKDIIRQYSIRKAEQKFHTLDFAVQPVLLSSSSSSTSTQNSAPKGRKSKQQQQQQQLQQMAQPLEQARQTITNYLHNDLIEYFLANIKRSIPSQMDGLKEGQRKILFAALLKYSRNNKLEDGLTERFLGEYIKISQLQGYVTERTAYHHGEACVTQMIIHMANRYVGGANMPYFQASGQYGTRAEGGNDASAARYLSTAPEWWWPYVYRVEDMCLLKFLKDENRDVEPEYFHPILPMVLVNGAKGTSSGWSTFIPNHNPEDIVAWLLARLQKQPLPTVHPWYYNFQGRIYVQARQARRSTTTANVAAASAASTSSTISLEEELPCLDDNDDDDEMMNNSNNLVKSAEQGEVAIDANTRMTMITEGTFKTHPNDTDIEITELPIGLWTLTYQQYLNKLRDNKMIGDYRENCRNGRIHFTLNCVRSLTNAQLCLKLAYGMSNMVLLDIHGTPQKFKNAEHILEVFFQERLKIYVLRKQSILAQLKKQHEEGIQKEAFLRAVREGKVEFMRDKVFLDEEQVVSQLRALGLQEHFYHSLRLNHFSEKQYNAVIMANSILHHEQSKVESCTPESMWISDLQLFLEAYKANHEIAYNSESKKKIKRFARKNDHLEEAPEDMEVDV